MKRSFLALGFWLFAFPAFVLAATTGSLKGTVSNAASGDPIVGANVVLDGTSLGGATDINGVYFVTNIPAGTYTVFISSVGYKTVEMTDLRIHADLLSEQDLALEESSVAGEVVTVFAERPLIELDKTASIQITDSDDLKQLPVRGYNEIIKIQSGVQTYNTPLVGSYYNESTNGPRISVRGSREDEVMFNVDGITLNDPASGFVTFRIPDLAWNEFAFLKGNFSAEYGRYMSGVANWTTKSGSDEYHVEAEITTDEVLNDDAHTFNRNKYGFAFGGPFIPGDHRYSFFVAYEHGDEGDRAPSFIDDGAKPMNGTIYDALTLKLTTQLKDNMRLDVGMLYSDEEWNEYRHSYLFNTARLPFYHDENLAFYGRFNHAVDQTLNYTITAGYTNIERFRGDDSLGTDISLYPTDHVGGYDETALFYESGRMYRNFMQRRTESLTFRTDVQKMVGTDHDIRSGFEMQNYTLRYYEHGFPNNWTADGNNPDLNNYGYDASANETDSGGDINGPKEPVTMGFYLQDKIRLDYGIRFDVGVRWDYLDPAARKVLDMTAPLGDDDALDMATETEDVDAFSIWSPRLGVSFPVSDVTTFHFNYGKYTQFPAFYTYYVDYDYYTHIVKNSPYHTVVANPDLKPVKTTSYEFGIDHAMGEYTSFAFTAYYKSMDDYVNSVNLPAQPSSYSTYMNMDRAISKGMEFEWRLRPYKRFSGALNYTVSWANGTGSSNDGNYRVAWTGSEPPKFTTPLIYDRRHHMSGILKYAFDKGDGPKIAGYPFLENTTVGVNLDVASGRPYTKKKVYNEVTLAANFPENERSLNSANIDWSYQLDIKLSRSFKFYGTDLDVFVNVINALETENYANVWESSGDASTTYWLQTNEGQNWLDRMASDNAAEDESFNQARARYQDIYELREDDPRNWSVPRMIQVGLTVSY